MLKLNEERFYLKFQEFLKESAGEDSKTLSLRTGANQTPRPGGADEDEEDETLNLQDTLSPEEKKKRLRDKVSKSRKKSWGIETPDDLLSKPDGYQNLKSLSKGIVKEKAKDKKPECVKGDKWHDSKGRFSTKKDAKSWAGGYERSNDSSCLAGKFSSKGSGRKFITKHKCGKAPDGSKEEFKCKDGKKYWEKSVVEEDAVEESQISGAGVNWSKISKGVALHPKTVQTIANAIRKEMTAAMKTQRCPNRCTWVQIIQAVDALNRAEKGKLKGK